MLDERTARCPYLQEAINQALAVVKREGGTAHRECAGCHDVEVYVSAESNDPRHPTRKSMHLHIQSISLTAVDPNTVSKSCIFKKDIEKCDKAQ